MLRSLFHIPPDTKVRTQIANPIVLGNHVEEKDIILDVNVLLNNRDRIDLEMQVANLQYWAARSLYYACRNYTTLDVGKDYEDLKSSIHIGLLDFTLFEDRPSFYDSYVLMEERSYQVYTDKFCIKTLNLSRIDLATDEDRQYNIDKWAQLFKTKTWEDLKMLAEQSPYFDHAARTIYKLTESERIRQQCEAREDYLRQQATLEHLLSDKDKQISRLTAVMSAKDAKISSQAAEMSAKDEKISSQAAEMSAKDEKISSQAAEMSAKDEKISSQAAMIEELKAQLAEKEQAKKDT